LFGFREDFPDFIGHSSSQDNKGLADVRRSDYTNTAVRCLYTCTILRVRLYTRTRDIDVHVARATAAERGQRVASLVNNAGRGNGAISAHLLLNIRFVVLSPRIPLRAHPALLPRSPLPTPFYSSRATHLSRPEPAPRHGRVTATLTALFLVDSG